MSVKFQYVGHSGETIVGLEPRDLSEEDYDALDYDHQQAVLLNRGSDGGPLYVEVHEAPATAILTEPDSGRISPTSDQPAQPALNQPLDTTAPAVGANN
jgi:hypothetical protein